MERIERLYRDMLDAPPAIALQLGVSGLGEDAARLREEVVDQVIQWGMQRHQAIYESATGLVDPDPKSPFGLSLVDLHHGDLEALFADPGTMAADLGWELTTFLEFGPRTELVNDEDGQRWVHEPSVLQTSPEARFVFAQAMTSIIDDVRAGTAEPVVPGRREAPHWAWRNLQTVSAAEVINWGSATPESVRSVWETVTPRQSTISSRERIQPSSLGATSQGFPF